MGRIFTSVSRTSIFHFACLLSTSLVYWSSCIAAIFTYLTTAKRTHPHSFTIVDITIIRRPCIYITKEARVLCIQRL